ncbi:hypothetical protein [Nitratireductor aquimarinus]|uniref:hypothetical protein n=1 Tax=Nitratireductor aquimarinus TaxID=889300 RepID=UPI003B5C5C66
MVRVSRPGKHCRLRFGGGEKLVIQADGALAVGVLAVIVALIFVFSGGAKLLLWLNGSSS